MAKYRITITDKDACKVREAVSADIAGFNSEADRLLKHPLVLGKAYAVMSENWISDRACIVEVSASGMKDFDGLVGHFRDWGRMEIDRIWEMRELIPGIDWL